MGDEVVRDVLFAVALAGDIAVGDAVVRDVDGIEVYSLVGRRVGLGVSQDFITDELQSPYLKMWSDDMVVFSL